MTTAAGGAFRLLSKALPDGKSERVFYGPASVAIIDKQGDIITGPALRAALPQLLRRARVSLNHQDILPGEILTKYVDGERTLATEVRPITEGDLTEFLALKQTETKVGDECLFMVAKIWDDAPFCDMVWEKMQQGELNCLSISGQAIAHTQKMQCTGLSCKAVKEIGEMALSAVTLCKVGANPGAVLNIVSKAYEFAADLPVNFIVMRKAWQFPLGTDAATKELLDQMDTRVRKGLDTDGQIAQAAAHLRKYMAEYGFTEKYIDSHNTVHAESGRVLGHHDTKAEAVKQLQAVEANKHKDSLDPPGDTEGIDGLKKCGHPIAKECPCMDVGAKDAQREMKEGSLPPAGMVTNDGPDRTAAKTIGGAMGASPPPRGPRLPKAPVVGGYTPTQKALDIELERIELMAKLDAMALSKYGPVPPLDLNYERPSDREAHGADVKRAKNVLARGEGNPDKLGPEHEKFYHQVASSPVPPKPLKPKGKAMSEAAKSRGVKAALAAIESGGGAQAALRAARDAQRGAAMKDSFEGVKGRSKPEPFSGRLTTPKRMDVGTHDLWTETREGNIEDARQNKTGWRRYQAANKMLDGLEKGWRPMPYKDRSGIMRQGAVNEQGTKLYGSDAMHALGQQAQASSGSPMDDADEMGAAPPSLEQRVRALEMKVMGMGGQGQQQGG